MGLKRTRAAVVFVTILVLSLYFLLPRTSEYALDYVLNHTVRRVTFPPLKTRLLYGNADVWREFNDSPYSDEVLDPIALKTFYMLKTGADVMWDRLPIHLETTLKRFPYHQIYADASAQIGNETVIDIIAELPSHLINDVQLEGYRYYRTIYDEAWGWKSTDLKKGELTSGWNVDKFKNIPMIYHAFKNAPKSCDWFVFADDDTYIHSQSLGSLLRNLNPKHRHYIGSKALLEGGFAMSGKVGEKRLKNAGPDEPVGLSFAHGGSGVIVSRGALDALFWDDQREIYTVNKYAELAIHTCCGDAMFGYMLREELELDVNSLVSQEDLKVDAFFGENIGATPVSVAGNGWCRRIIAWHHLEPQNIQQFYDWERSLVDRKNGISTRSGNNIEVMFSDVYNDFILPYIGPVMEYWRILGWADEYVNPKTTFLVSEDDYKTLSDVEKETIDNLPEFSPASSLEMCQHACEVHPKCLGYMFSEAHGEQPMHNCNLEHTVVSRGTNTHPFLGTDESQQYVVSGYMVDRIRKLRAQESCDWLEYNPETNQYNDNDDESEGWYFRKLLKEQNGKPDEPVY